MLEFFGLVAVVIAGVIVLLLALWFGMGAMHQHLKNKGEGFGRDTAMHDKLDRLIADQDKRRMQ